jgi:hypothetical protein
LDSWVCFQAKKTRDFYGISAEFLDLRKKKKKKSISKASYFQKRINI